jgi:3-oxoacyl-[acyl-carrier protein] reductase
MPDRYAQLVTSPLGGKVADALGLPQPEPLRRYEPGQPLVGGPVLIGGAEGGALLGSVRSILEGTDAQVVEHADDVDEATPFGAVVFDASGITDSQRLRELFDFFHPVIRRLVPSGRVVVLGTPPADCTDARAGAAQRALEGFVRSVAKELQRGATAQTVYVAPRAEDGIESTLRFLLSAKSAYVDAQAITVAVRGTTPANPPDWERPLDGKVALVTGAAQGIGEAVAHTLSRDGAHVVCLDIPVQGEPLAAVANAVGGSTLQVDITDEDAPQQIAEHLEERHGGVDVVVHNAGVTRDKTLAGMDEQRWDMVMGINLSSQERIDDVLLDGVLNEGGRIVCVSSLSGIAGNRGQTNYAASKAGVIGMVEATAEQLDGGRTINAVAPGFIETNMTDAMPFGVREAGRRMSSLGQGGQPVDVAETIAWFASPASSWVNGNVVRVCGQSLLGA